MLFYAFNYLSGVNATAYTHTLNINCGTAMKMSISWYHWKMSDTFEGHISVNEKILPAKNEHFTSFRTYACVFTHIHQHTRYSDKYTYWHKLITFIYLSNVFHTLTHPKTWRYTNDSIVYRCTHIHAHTPNIFICFVSLHRRFWYTSDINGCGLALDKFQFPSIAFAEALDIR